MNTALGALLHLVDPTLPIGGFNHSNGLETFVQQQVVHDAKTLSDYVHQQLMQNWVYNDGAFMALAFDAAQQHDVATLIQLDAQLGATKAARELCEGSQKLGVRLLKIFMRVAQHQQNDLLISLQTAITTGEIKGFYPLIFGVIACIENISKADALYALYYNMAVGTVTNGVKLIPLSQMAGQDLMFALRPAILDAITHSINPDIEWLGACTVAHDIRAMQHEQLYTRLYMS